MYTRSSYQRDTLSEGAVSLRTVVKFVTWSSSGTDFVAKKLFYNVICVTSFLKGWDGKRKLSSCLPNTSTFVPNDRSQCLFCVLSITRCAFGGGSVLERDTLYIDSDSQESVLGPIMEVRTDL